MRAVLSRGHRYAVSRTFHTISALVGFGKARGGLFSSLGMDDPPTALVGFGGMRVSVPCSLDMNDPPTALVGFGQPRGGRLVG